MKNISLFLLSLLFVVSCTQNQTETSTAQTVNADEFKLEKVSGTELEKASKYDKDGKLILQGFLKNGLKTGEWVEFNTEGKIVSITSFWDGKFNGYYFGFDGRGNLENQAYFKNDKLDGKVLKIKYGNTEEEINFKDGKLNGLKIKYSRSGKPIQETEYKDDKKHGFDKYYDDDGVLDSKYEYKNGKQIGGGKVKKEKE